MATYLPEDLLSTRSVEERSSFWTLLMHDDRVFFYRGRVDANVSKVEWSERAAPRIKFHYEDSAGGCLVMAGARTMVKAGVNGDK